MRILLEKLNDNINFNKIEHLKCVKKKIINLYSDEGIFEISDNSIKKIIIKDDSNFFKVVINNLSFICDKSTIDYDLNIYKLPFNYNKEVIEKYVYTISPNLELVIEIKHKYVHNLYFILNDNTISEIIMQKINNVLKIIY